jgi:hypothetical protein
MPKQIFLFTKANTMKTLLKVILCCFTMNVANAQLSCNSLRLADVPGPGRYNATACSNNQFALVGGGKLSFSGNEAADFYLYTLATDTWAQVQDYPLGGHEGMISFEINGRFFAGMGTPFIQPSFQLYELDLSNLIWIPRASAPGTHLLIDAYVVNGKAYVIPVYVGNDSKIIEYNPELDSWRIVTDFNTTQNVQYPIGFVLGNSIYFGMGPGALSSGSMRKWFRFDTETETVVQLNDVPVASDQSCAFKIGNTGYVYNVGQNLKDMYRYNQTSDTWDLMCSFADNRMANASAFGDENYGFVVFGQNTNSQNTSSNELWRFEPVDLTSNLELNTTEKAIQLFSDGTGAISVHFPKTDIYQVSVYDLTGRCISTETMQINASDLNLTKNFNINGLHFIQIKSSNNEILVNKKILI